MCPVVSLTSLGTQTSTPPRASTIFLKPLKSMTTKWLIRMSVSSSTVLIVHAGPPTAYAALNMLRPPGSVPLPSLRSHSGRWTIASRGRLTPYASFRSAERCSRIVVSERPGRVAADVPGLPLAGVGAEQQDVERLVRLAGLRDLGRPVVAQGSGDVDRGDVPVEVPVDEEAAGEDDQQDQRHGDGHGLHDPVPGHPVSVSRNVLRQCRSSGRRSILGRFARSAGRVQPTGAPPAAGTCSPHEAPPAPSMMPIPAEEYESWRVALTRLWPSPSKPSAG